MTISKHNTVKFVLSIMFCSFFSINSVSADYPKPIEERKYEQMGSLLSDDGIQFNINKVEHTPLKTAKATKVTKDDTNYLWLAALENVKYMPLNSADFKGGIIITDWISNDKRSTQRFKVSIYIKSDALSLNSFEVNIYSEEFKRGQWVADRNKQELLKTKMTNDILSLAKELKGQGKRNK
jgi:hypothetical protein